MNLENLNGAQLFNLIINNKLPLEKYINNKKQLIDLFIRNFNLFDYYSLLVLKENNNFKKEVNELFSCTIDHIFSNKSKIFLFKIFKDLLNKKVKEEDLINYIFLKCKEKDTISSSAILFDLSIFQDFNEAFKKLYPVSHLITKASQRFNPDIIGADMFKGSSIIGKLIKDNNEQLLLPYIDDYLKQINYQLSNFKMIGGGGSSLVFLVNDKILKIGETRNNRLVYINHRILMSKIRKLITRDDGEEICYFEVMNRAITGDVTEEERDELRRDLLKQGLNWHDDKLENCGVLQENDQNELPIGNKPDWAAAIIDNPYEREKFNKRKRRVVVIDNDFIDPSYGKLYK